MYFIVSFLKKKNSFPDTVTGGARDWAFDEINAKNSYVIELRDKGEYGFILPKQQILPTANETWEGVKAMALELIKSL